MTRELNPFYVDGTFEIRAEDVRRLSVLRDRVFRMIAECLADDDHCKSYEGAIDLGIPGYFDERRWHGAPEEDRWAITLHCYLVCDHRHETWTGASLEECLDKMEADVDRWEQGHKQWWAELTGGGS